MHFFKNDVSPSWCSHIFSSKMCHSFSTSYRIIEWRKHLMILSDGSVVSEILLNISLERFCHVFCIIITSFAQQDGTLTQISSFLSTNNNYQHFNCSAISDCSNGLAVHLVPITTFNLKLWMFLFLVIEDGYFHAIESSFVSRKTCKLLSPHLCTCYR